MFWELRDWKQKLLIGLNEGAFILDQWQSFMNAAIREGCYEMAIDMQKRFEYYKNRQTEANKCTKN